jgi:hypothetical protein
MGIQALPVPMGTYSLKLAPGSYTVQVSDGSSNCITSPSANINITNGGTTDHSACLSGSPQIKINGSTISGGNGDNVINPNECNSMIVDLANIGCGGTRMFQLSCPRIRRGFRWNNLIRHIQTLRTALTVPTLFLLSFSTAPPFVCGTVINFTLTVTTDQGVVCHQLLKAYLQTRHRYLLVAPLRLAIPP